METNYEKNIDLKGKKLSTKFETLLKKEAEASYKKGDSELKGHAGAFAEMKI